MRGGAEASSSATVSARCDQRISELTPNASRHQDEIRRKEGVLSGLKSATDRPLVVDNAAADVALPVKNNMILAENLTVLNKFKLAVEEALQKPTLA